MSQPSKSISEQVEEFDLSLDTLREVYHVPVLAALFAFMLWVRTRGWSNFVNGREVLFSGNDAYYHYRMVQYTVNQWPATMPFDPWTSFPTGTSVGQFGTLFDQLIATGALLYGLGSPSVYQTKLVALFAPAILGALAVIPTFYIGKRLGGKAGGLIAALILALTPGQFLTRSVVGFTDHHVGETLFMAIAVVFIMAALAVAKQDRPIWELFTARDLDALRSTLLWAALAGVGIGLYVWVWPPGVFLAGIVAVFLVLYLLGTYVRGGVPDHVGIPGAVMMTVATVLLLVPLNTFSFSATQFSLAQPFVTASAALACGAIVGAGRLWERQDLSRSLLPAALVVAGLVVVGLVAVLAPDVFGFFRTQVDRVAGFGATTTARTVAEATPVQNPSQFVYTSYGLAFYTAIGGLLLLTYRTLRADTIDPVGTFVIVWTLFLLAATLTQRRFDYYFILSVAALNAFLAKEVFELLGLYDLTDSVTDIQGYQVLSIVAVLLIITAPLAMRTGQGGLNNVVDQAQGQTASPGEVANWESGLQWLDAQTPQEGQWGSDPQSALGDDPYATYERTDDFAYRSGDYGVLAWWDYGHWITVLGDRVPNANPFQQNADYSANVLLSTDESYAYDAMMNTSGDGEQTRYVMLDYQMGLAGTRKFSAPSAWETRYTVDNTTGAGYAGEPPADASVHDLGPSDLSTTVFVAQQTQQGQLQPISRYAVQSQRSMESFRTRLYQYHGSRAEPTFQDGSVVVADWENAQFQGQGLRVVTSQTQPIRTFPNRTAAEEYVRQNPTSQIGGVLGKPSEPVPAMEHYRLVWASQRSSPTPVSRGFAFWNRVRGQQAGNIETQPYLKTFERVPGAEVTGAAAPNTTVTASVRMEIPTNGRTFTYEQQTRTDEDGQFTMTVPYSTTGYDEWGPEQGHTNVSVRATGPYSFTTPGSFNETGAIVQYNGVANITEAQVIGADDATVAVNMQERVLGQAGGADGGNGTNATNSTDSTNGTDTTNSTDSTNSSDGTETTPTPTPTGSSTATPTATPSGDDTSTTSTPTPVGSLAPLAAVGEFADLAPSTLAGVVG